MRNRLREVGIVAGVALLFVFGAQLPTGHPVPASHSHTK